MPTAATKIDPATAVFRHPVDHVAARRAMIASQLRTNDVNDPALIAAFDAVPREAHVPAERAAQAYGDRAIPLGGGRALNPALTTAQLIADIDPAAGDRLLLIGGATGYAAAVLAQLGVEVTVVEQDAALADLARDALAGVAGITLVVGPLVDGAPAGAPYDALLIDGAVEFLPTTLTDQLRDGARIACGVNDRGVTRLARGVRTQGASAVALTPFAELESVSLPGFVNPPRFAF